MQDMDSHMRFLVYCTELYRAEHGLSGNDVIDLFDRCRVLEYIDEFYGALHCMGDAYILEDIHSLIEERMSGQQAS